MLRCMLGVLGLSLGFDLGRRGISLFNPSALIGLPFLLMAWPIFCFGGLMAGVNLGSRLDLLFRRQEPQPLEAARNRRWLVRSLGLIQSSFALAIIVVLAFVLPATPIARSLSGLDAARPALIVVGAGMAWLMLVKGWFELLTGVRFQEWPSFWGSLSSGRKLAWIGGLYGFGIPLMLLPGMILMRLVMF